MLAGTRSPSIIVVRLLGIRFLGMVRFSTPFLRRPFFQEAERYLGSDLFYTRRVSNPKFAFKLTGKERGYTIGVLGALNESEDDNQYLGIFRVKKDIFKFSSLTTTYSGYKTPDFTNHNGGLELNLQFSKAASMFFMSNFAYNSDIEKRNNGHYYSKFSYFPDEGLSFHTSFRRVEKNYRPRAGYQPRRDFGYWHIMPGYSKRINKSGIKKIVYNPDIYFYQDASGQNLGHIFSPLYLALISLKQHEVYIWAAFGKHRTQVYGEEGLEWTENFFKVSNIGFGTRYSGSRFYSFQVSASYSLTPVYNEEFTEAFDGKHIGVGGEFGLKPTSFFNLSFELEYTKQNIKATGEEVFEGILTSANLHYQVTRQVFLSSYLQHDSHFKRVNLDLLLGIELGMGNVISFSYKGFYPMEGSPFEDKARSFVLKASYLIRL